MTILVSKDAQFLRIFWFIQKLCTTMYTYRFAHAKVKTWIFCSKIQRICNNFGIIRNEFKSSTNWVVQIEYGLTGVENPKIPGIQPTNTVSAIRPYRKILTEKDAIERLMNQALIHYLHYQLHCMEIQWLDFQWFGSQVTQKSLFQMISKNVNRKRYRKWFRVY